MPLKELLQRIEKNSRLAWYHLSEKLICTTVINFNLGIQNNDLLDKHWVYFPEEEYPFYRLGFWHNISRALVKDGCSALYGELSFIPGTIAEKKREKIIHQAITKALDFLRINRSQVVAEKILTLEHAYVIYDNWREKNLSALLAQLAYEGVFSVGRFGGWNYSSMQEAVGFGKQVAEQLLMKEVPVRNNEELAKL